MFKNKSLILFFALWTGFYAPFVCASEVTEPYSARPKIETVTPVSHLELGPVWKKLKLAQLEMTAQIMEMYPDRDIFFFARDMEYGYDLWRKLSAGNKQEHERAHLLNVSQTSKDAEVLESYLLNHGLTKSKIISGRKVLFVDTGYYGSVLQTIKEKFSAAQPGQIAAQLITSGNTEFSSSRSFLVQVDPSVADIRPALLHSVVKEYERLPHYTEKSEHYEKIGDHWEPMSAVAESSQQREALLHMQDLAFFADDPKVKAHFEERRKFWRGLKRLELSENRGQTIRYLKDLLSQHPKDAVTRAAVRDFLEMTHLNPDGDFPMNITVRDVGLEPEITETFPMCLQLKFEQNIK